MKTYSDVFDGGWYNTKEYTDGALMFEKRITSNRDNYTYELSDGLKQFKH